MSLNIIALVVLVLTALLSLRLIARRLSHIPDSILPTCGGCGAPADQVHDFICSSCKRDVRECGMPVPPDRPRQALVFRVWVASMLVCISGALICIAAWMFLPLQRNGLSYVTHTIQAHGIEQISMLAAGRSWTGSTLDGRLWGEIYLSDGRVARLESDTRGGSAALFDTNGARVADDLPLDIPAFSRWLDLAATMPPSSRDHAADILYRNKISLIQGISTPDSGAMFHAIQSAPDAGTSTSGASNALVIPIVTLVLCPLWIALLIRILRRGREAAE